MSFATLRARQAARLGAIATFALATLSMSVVPGLSSAHAASTHPTAAHSTSTSARAARAAVVAHHHTLTHKVIAEAKKQKGKPYEYGGAGPHAFDCSGLVRYVYLHAVGRSLPHNAAEQYHSVRHLHKRSDLQLGDLVFVDNGGYISHVGIYAGDHHWWVAPHTGTHVKLQRIYHAHFLYGRVITWHKR